MTDTSTGETTYFYYDHTGQRTATVYPEEGKIIYYPFPGYEVEMGERCTIEIFTGKEVCTSVVNAQRATYSLAGQPIAHMENGAELTFIHSDHLGSVTALTTATGTTVAGSVTRYLPYGEERTSPTTTLSDFGFTGHKENRDLGLVYANFRYYVPEIGRFNKADTIVPEPGRAVGFNRYAYTYNNPIKYNDPSGHIAVCFQGGPGSGEYDENSAMTTKCEDDLANSGHAHLGQIVVLPNDDEYVRDAVQMIINLVESGSEEPIILMGYSNGGAAVMETLWLLASLNNPIDADTAILFDPMIRSGFAAGSRGKLFPWATFETEEGTDWVYYPTPLGIVPPTLDVEVYNFYGEQEEGLGFGWREGSTYIFGATNTPFDANHTDILNVSFDAAIEILDERHPPYYTYYPTISR